MKYIIHPGYIRSKNDNDEHYVSADRLARLYKLKPWKYTTCPYCFQNTQYLPPDLQRCQNAMTSEYKDKIHLFPNYDGDYDLPDMIPRMEKVTKLKNVPLTYSTDTKVFITYPCGCRSEEQPKYAGTPDWQNRWLCPKCHKAFSR